jgi:hypothetical protein
MDLPVTSRKAKPDNNSNVWPSSVQSVKAVFVTDDSQFGFAPQLADEFAVSFEFRARWFLRDRIQQGKKGRFHDFQAP